MFITSFNFLYVIVFIYKIYNNLKFFLFALRIELRSINTLINFNFNQFLRPIDRVSIYYYVIKFQKRGLLYAHILIILHFKNRFLNVNEINFIINIKLFN